MEENNQQPAQKPKNTKKLILIGLAVLSLVFLAIAGIWVVNSGLFSPNPEGVLNYSARNPEALKDRLNRENKVYYSALTSLDLTELQNDPIGAIQPMWKDGEVAVEYEIDGEINVANNQAVYTFDMDGQLGYNSPEFLMDGKFKFKSGVGINFGINGEVRFVDGTLYTSIPNTGMLIGTDLPTKWISLSSADIEKYTGEMELSQQILTGVESQLSEHASFQGDYYADAKPIESRNISGIELPCVELIPSEEYLDFLLDAAETGGELSTQNIVTPGYVFCADGEAKPIFMEAKTEVKSGTQTVASVIGFTIKKLDSMPNITAPDETEVTTITELFAISDNKIAEGKDATLRTQVNSISNAISLYITDNSGQSPKLNSGKAIPRVDFADMSTQGADASELSNALRRYITSIPVSPDGSEYKIAVDENGVITVMGTLSDGTPFIVQQ